MAVRIEDAGFEIRDMIAWVYGSGFPKSLDVSKAIDKAAGAEREVVGTRITGAAMSGKASGIENGQGGTEFGSGQNEVPITAPATPEAKQWQGWGTALKPALEPITVARKPLIGTVAENVLQHGTGAINVDGGRVGTGEALGRFNNARTEGSSYIVQREAGLIDNSNGLGRWPANFIHDGSEEATDLLGASARFFYCAKASKADRDEGCEGMEQRKAGAMSGIETREGKPTNHPMRTNFHPTVKPTDLMRYLCRLVTPPSGTVLDPFMGSGSTGKAAMLEGFAFVGIEREAEYIDIAKARIQSAVGLL
jgi:site-specific DNA-methyltransferase (adenine-specific)